MFFFCFWLVDFDGMFLLFKVVLLLFVFVLGFVVWFENDVFFFIFGLLDVVFFLDNEREDKL